METNFTSLTGDYALKSCTIDDVYKDIEFIKEEYVTPQYIDSMIDAVYQEYAYGVFTEGKRVAFLYFVEGTGEFKEKIIACSLYSSDTTALLILLLTSTISRWPYLVYVPHEDTAILKSLISRSSLKAFNSGYSKYVTITNADLRRKFFTVSKFIRLHKVK